ncbi:MAG TPA: type VI secretion system baseplate subunit TssF [Candidatus Acidoferrales bacterium]|nr:type VI secretion system baseplate subunit TssF [Candidatus Acidoferrales bacterium]
MRDELLPYYERELKFIRQMAGEFAAKYPKVAGRLLLQPGTCEDPHVERLIEAFALIAGRVHHKLDDEFPEITEALLDVLYPHYLRPVPPQGIVQFQLDPSQSAPASTKVPVGLPIHTTPERGHVCSFRTCYPVTLWPLRVTGASVSPVNRFAAPGMPADAAAVIRIGIECLGGLRLEQLPLDSIRFYLNGESAAVHTLYEFLFLDALRVAVRALPAREGTAQAILPAGSLQQVGFTTAEGILPYSDRSFLGYRLLQEYFTFPEKFLFVDVKGFQRLPKAGFGTAFEILIYLKQPDQPHRLVALEQSVGIETFQLGCTPMVNLFERIAEPVRITQTKSEYLIIPDQHQQLATEVYSVDRVISANYLDEIQTYEPFYSLRHGTPEEAHRHFWYAHRRPSFRKNDHGTDVYLSLVDLDFNPAVPPVDMLSLRVTCTNRDQASRLSLSGEFGELQPEGAALLRARCLRKPTPPLRPPMRRGLEWRLISHLSLNHLSIVEKGKQALQEILRLYDFSDDSAIRKQIAGIAGVSSRSSISRVVSPTGVTFCRGTDVTIEFDEEQYVGTGVFLLACVLQRFLGLYSAVNSFSRVTARTRKGVIKQWPPLTGEQILL